MATKITGAPAICYISSSHSRGSQDLSSPPSDPFILPLINGQCKIKNPYQFLKFDAKYGIYNYRSVSIRRKFLPKASASGDSPPPSWKKWLLGALLTVILPACGHKGGLFIALKSKINQAVETVESVTELVEEIAEETEKLAEQVEEKLPQDSQFKHALDSVENLAKKAIVEAKHAEDLIHKVQEVEEKIEGALLKAETDMESQKTSSKNQPPSAK